MFHKTSSSVCLFSFMFYLIFINVNPLIGQSKEKANRIAVFPFDDSNKSAKEEEYGEAISSMIMTELINGNVFQVIERSEIDRMMNELSLQISGVVDASTAKKIGEVFGVDILVFGNVAKFGNLVETDIRLVDTQSGEALLAEHESSRSSSEIRDMVQHLARKIEDRFLGRYMAKIEVSSSPQNADVYLDDEKQGTTPLKVNVIPGKHTIRISKENYRTWERSIDVPEEGGAINTELEMTAAYRSQLQQRQQRTQKESQTEPAATKGKDGGGSAVWWIVGGLAAAGGAAAFLLLGGKENEEESNTSSVNVVVELP